MEAQRCSICGARHWRYQPHVWPKSTDDVGIPITHARTQEAVERAIKRVASDTAHICQGGSVTIEGRAEEPRKPKFDRNAYMRDYMRKRRAEAKGAK